MSFCCCHGSFSGFPPQQNGSAFGDVLHSIYLFFSFLIDRKNVIAKIYSFSENLSLSVRLCTDLTRKDREELMRLIGQLPDTSNAQIFSDYLYVQGINNNIEPADGEMCNIWVHEEQQIENAKSLLERFRKNPNDEKFRKMAKTARQQKEQEEKEYKAFQKRFLTRGKIFPGGISQIGVLTGALIVISVAVGLISKLGTDRSLLNYLFITQYQVSGQYMRWYRGLPEIFQGQIWRLFTPMFIHFGVLHLLFNMLWLKDLGSMIERHQRSWILALLVFIIAAASNLAQYIVSGPSFGGMSGVVYGLLGYVWMRGKYDPFSGLFLHQQTVVMMIVWFFLCLSGVMGNIANMAHGAGLVIGVIWGVISARLAKRKYIR